MPAQPPNSYDGPVIIGPYYREIEPIIKKLGPQRYPVLILGETGTGKELIAKAIHYHGRRGRQFIAINSSTIPKELAESKLFGYEKGAYTGAITQKAGLFELAHNGTLFLDEVEAMSSEIQPKLLRVVEDYEVWRVGAIKPVKVNTRVITASSVSLEELVHQGAFRYDLYNRLNDWVITLPPLRQRRDDIKDLVLYFLKEDAGLGRDLTISPESMELLMSYNWPGNVRQLMKVIRRAVGYKDMEEANYSVLNKHDFEMAIRMSESELHQVDDNKTRTPTTLGIMLQILRDKLTRYIP